MSNLIEIKNLFDKELKKFKKIIKTVTDKYKEISEEHELLLADVEALDTRLIFVEKKLKISNDFDIYNNSTNNIKDLSEFRYQIITRSKARQMKNKQKLNNSDENEEENSNDNLSSEEKRSKKNSKKNNQRKKTKSKSKEKSKNKNKNKRNYSNKNNQEKRNKNKLEQTYSGINPLLINDNNNNNFFYANDNNDNDINNNINNDNNDIMSFKNKNINININNIETKSLLSTSEHFSEFSFNPQKLQNKSKKISSIVKSPLINDLKNIINSDIIQNIQEIELIIKSVHNYNKFDAPPTIQAIFQSSLNGDSAQTFHKFCDGEPNVIVVLETKKGKRFGGFTTIGFNSDNGAMKDSYSFLFSFDLMKIYKSKREKKNIYCNENTGPYFGDKNNKDLVISDKCFINDSFVGKTNGCFLNMNSDYELNEGNSNFVINKLEIFKLLI